jgi:hypothetical protein
MIPAERLISATSDMAFHRTQEPSMATRTPTTPSSRAGLAALALFVIGSLAGCGAQSARPGAGPPALPPSSPVGPSSGAPAGTGSVGVAPPRQDSVCRAADLTQTTGVAQQAMQHFGRVVLVRLRGVRRCTLVGYPGVLLVGSTGRPLPTSTRRDGSYLFPAVPPRPVTLTTGETASFALGGPAADPAGSASCPLATAVRIIPPNDVTTVRVAMTLPDCGTIDVSPVVPGAVGPTRS